MTLEHVMGRLLAGSSYGFQQAVEDRLRDDWTCTLDTAESAIEAAAVLVREVHKGGTEWHVCRGIEAMHHVDWLHRKAVIVRAGPYEPAAVLRVAHEADRCDQVGHEWRPTAEEQARTFGTKREDA